MIRVTMVLRLNVAAISVMVDLNLILNSWML